MTFFRACDTRTLLLLWWTLVPYWSRAIAVWLLLRLPLATLFVGPRALASRLKVSLQLVGVYVAVLVSRRLILQAILCAFLLELTLGKVTLRRRALFVVMLKWQLVR